jgi:hypothetical protein
MNIHAVIRADVPNLIQNPDWQTPYATADIQHSTRRIQAKAPNETLCLRLGGNKKEIVVLEFPSSKAQVLSREDRSSMDSAVGCKSTVYFRENAPPWLHHFFLSPSRL